MTSLKQMKVASTINTFFVLLFIVVSSCKKDNLQQTTASGTVIDATTQQPIPNAEVWLLAAERTFSLGSFSGGSAIDSKITDAEGKFNFSFEASDDYMYNLYTKTPRYLDYGVSSLTSVNRGKKNKLTLELHPEAFLKAHIKRITPSGPFLYIGLLNPSDGRQVAFNMNYVDTTVIIPRLRGNTNYKVEWEDQDKSTNFTRFSKNVYFPAHDTTTVLIEY